MSSRRRSSGPAALPRLPTHDVVGGGGELVVTRLEAPDSGVVIEGRFSLGWIGRLTPDQVELVGLLLARRNNLQRLAGDLGLSYNTVRARFEEIVSAIGEATGAPSLSPAAGRPDRRAVLARLAAGEIDPDEAGRLLEGRQG